MKYFANSRYQIKDLQEAAAGVTETWKSIRLYRNMIRSYLRHCYVKKLSAHGAITVKEIKQNLIEICRLFFFEGLATICQDKIYISNTF